MAGFQQVSCDQLRFLSAIKKIIVKVDGFDKLLLQN